MKRLAPAAALLLGLAACSNAPEPVATGPRLAAELETRFRDSAEPGRGAEFSRDGRWLATSSASGLIVLRRAPGLRPVRRLHHPGGAAAVAFSPDGRWLASSGYDGAVRLWAVPGGRPVRTLEGARGTVWTLHFSPDGRLLAAAGEDGIARIWRPEDGRLVRQLAGHARNVWEARFSPDGRRLATGSFDATARIWDVATGRTLATLSDHGQAVVGLAWSADGRWLATGGDDSAIFLRRTADGRAVRRIEVGNHAYKLVFSPDSRWLANGGRARSGPGTLWHSVTGAGGEAVSVRLWRVADGALVQALKSREDVMFLDFGRDGRRLVTSAEDGEVALWRLRVEGAGKNQLDQGASFGNPPQTGTSSQLPKGGSYGLETDCRPGGRRARRGGGPQRVDRAGGRRHPDRGGAGRHLRPARRFAAPVRRG